MNAKLLVSFLLGTVLATSGARGQWWNGGSCYAPACYGYGFSAAYATDSVPYFSVHPPVYYSYRVARTYGLSPFAYPPDALPSGSESRRMGVDDRRTGSEMDETPEPRPPLRIENPFVEQANGPAVTKSPKRRPQIIYPASLVKRS